MKRLAPLALAAALATTQAGCYGTYSATNTLNRWNGTVSDNKIVTSAVHLGLWIIPVYELAIVGDFFIFNTVEFLQGRPVFH